jgi:hypothetical protein
VALVGDTTGSASTERVESTGVPYVKLWLLVGEPFKRGVEDSFDGVIVGEGSDSTTSQVSNDSRLSLSFPLKDESVRATKLSRLSEAEDEVEVKGSRRNEVVDIDILSDVVLKNGKAEREHEYGEEFGDG